MKGGKPQRRKFHHRQVKRSAAEATEIAELERCIAEQAPPRGTNPLSLADAAPPATQGKGGGGAPGPAPPEPGGLSLLARRFDGLPISACSKEGLAAAGYKQLTAIQRAALPHALAGRDVLGAAKTEYAYSLGLPTAPKLRFLKRAGMRMADGGAGGDTAAVGEGDAAQRRQQQQHEGRRAGGKRGAPSADKEGAEEEEGGSSSEGEGSSSGEEGEEEAAEAAQQGRRARGGDAAAAAAASAAAAAAAAAAGADSDDDLLVVKTRNVFGVEEAAPDAAVAAAAGEAAGAAGAGAGAAGGQRRKKLRIRAGALAPGRLVFDEEGRPVDPLAALAAGELGGGGGGGGSEDEEGGGEGAPGGPAAGLDAGVHGSVSERAAAARAVLQARDREDRRQLRELRRRARAEKRARRLAREAAERGAPAAVLGPAGDGGAGDDGGGGGGGGSSEEEGEEEEKARGAPRGGRRWGGVKSSSEEEEEEEGSGPDIDLLESSEDEGERGPQRKGRRRQQQAAGRRRKRASARDDEAVEVAHLGMAPAPAAAGGGGAGGDTARKKTRRVPLSLAEQEALALRLIAGGGRMSLLSKALAGGAPQAPPVPQAKVDSQSFPCIREGEVYTDDATAELEKLSLDARTRQSLPGSAPTAHRLAGSFTASAVQGSHLGCLRTEGLRRGAADYELNPYRLRGGEEYVSSASLKDHAANFLTDAVIRSLPRALTSEQKAAAIAASPLSPTMNLLSTLPMDRVAGRSMEGRKLRRHVLRGAVVVFITAGYSGKRFIFERAKELGCRLVFDRCLEAIQAARRQLGDLDGIACFSELAVPLASRLQERLGLPCNSPAAVDAARDKSQTRAIMGAAGLPTPRNMLVTSEAGSNAPSILPASQQRELVDLAVSSVQALGLATLKYTSRGPRLIEVNCRMGGGPGALICTMNRLVWGVDLVEEQLLAACGIPSRPPVAAKPLQPIAEFSVNAMRTGILRDVSFLDKYQSDPQARFVLYARPLVEPGSRVVCVEDGLPTWVCELMVTSPDIHDAIAKVKGMEVEIQQCGQRLRPSAFHQYDAMAAPELAAAALPPQAEIVFALQQRGIGTLECLTTLQAAPSLATSADAALEVAACLAQPFVIEEGNAEIVREGALQACAAQETDIAARYAREVAATGGDRRRRPGGGGGGDRLLRPRAPGDAGLDALLGAGHARGLEDLCPGSTSLMMAALVWLPPDASHHLRLEEVKELAPPTDTIDMVEPDEGYLLNTAAGSLAGSLYGSVLEL
eukprot:scaffold13.g177.t1